MTAKSVYVISSGSYSDYRVHAVVDGTRAEAEHLAARASASGDTYDAYMVEELPVVRHDVEQVDVLRLTVTLWDDDTVDRAPERYCIEWPFDGLYRHVPVERRWVRAPVHKGKGGRLDVTGVDHERVRKVFSDTLAMLRTDDALRARREIVRWPR